MRKKIIRKKRLPSRFPLRKRICIFCSDKSKKIDYKDVAALTKFTTERGKIASRRGSGLCASHQRKVAAAIKQARFIALLPFIRQ